MAVLPILAEVVTAEIPVNRYSAPGVRVEGVTGSYQLEDQHTAAVLCHHTKQIIGSSMATEYPPPREVPSGAANATPLFGL